MRVRFPTRRTLLALVLVATVSIGTAGAVSGYSISASNAIQTPEQTVTLQSTQYTVSSVAQVERGEPVTFDTSGPNGTSYDVYLYSSDRQIIATQSVDAAESGTVTFDTTGYDPGSYLAAVYAEGDFKTIQPVVVAGYDLAVSAPTSAGVDETPTVTVSATPTASSGTPASLEVVLMNDGTTMRVNATRADGQYETTLPLSEVSSGEYDLYAVAHGSATGPDGNRVITALSSPTPFTVTAAESTSESDSSSGGGGGGGGGSVSEETTTTTATTTTSTTSTNTTSTTSESTTTRTTTTSTTTSETSDTSTETSTQQEERSTETSTETSETTSSGSSPGTGPFALGALLLALALVARARSGR